MSDIVVGLDIGTSMIRVVIGEITEDNRRQIIGLGSCQSTGVRNGVIVNIEATMQAIAKAIEDAELSSGYEVESCVASIGGTQIEGQDSTGIVAVTQHGQHMREISRDDVDRALEAATAIVIPMDRKLLHVIPQSFTIDGQGGIKDPINNIGKRLEVSVHIITCSITSVESAQRCITRAGYGVDSIMFKALAASKAVLTEEELELGSILIDLGAGTTDVLVLDKGAPICTVSIPVGGWMVTRDLTYGKSIPFETAEWIKVSAGSCWESLIEDPEEAVTVPGVGGRPPENILKTDICRILQPRMTEIFEIVREKIRQNTSVRRLSGNIVLIGGGALMPGVTELVQYVFQTSAVRVGIPGGLGNAVKYRTPEYATAAGLLLHSLDSRKTIEINRNKQYDTREPNIGKKIAGKIKKVLGDFF